MAESAFKSSLNDQIVDSVAAVNFVGTGFSHANSQAMLNAVMAETLGMAMHNAVMRQQANSLVSSAATTAACAKMLQADGSGITPSPPPPPLGPGPVIPPLDGPDAGPVAVAKAAAKANSAINDLEGQASAGQYTENLATSTLSNIQSAISGFMNKTPAPAPVAPAKPKTGPMTGQ